MTRRKSESAKRIAQLEKQLISNGAGSDLFERAMAEVIQEATYEELIIAAGSEKNRILATDAQMADMHEVFRSRAEQKIKQFKDEKEK
ncbi:hypothetical protein [uncultured Trichococcus sp.]|uniref:hypothetical protein n=1 Tax=uncultured Trichococcus sp. TaxID=189665 RepID=UPI0029C6D618|nr:hypothetical protein [uncultured Trichococcus sp.]